MSDQSMHRYNMETLRHSEAPEAMDVVMKRCALISEAVHNMMLAVPVAQAEQITRDAAEMQRYDAVAGAERILQAAQVQESTGELTDVR